MITALNRRAWILAYDLEETRQRTAYTNNLWVQAGACIGLALLRFFRIA